MANAKVAVIKRTGIPAKKYIARPSQITRIPPTKRLKKRRTASPREGYFPNPSVSQSRIDLVKRSMERWFKRLEPPKPGERKWATNDLVRQSIVSYLEGVIETMADLQLFDKAYRESLMSRLEILADKR